MVVLSKLFSLGKILMSNCLRWTSSRFKLGGREKPSSKGMNILNVSTDF